MLITTVLFDLDGTLLPMDQDLFVRTYLDYLARYLVPHGYDPGKVADAIWLGTGAMIKNDGTATNADVFWKIFESVCGEGARKDEPIFEEFYRTRFQDVAAVCGFNPKAAQTVAAIREKGLRTALATNPLFPSVATESRTRWAGLDPADFELITVYDNSRRCKPNPDYYRDVVQILGVTPEECLMVGNDADEDMVAQTLGMKVFLLTDCLINRHGRDISRYPQGSFDDLMAYIESLK